MASITATIRELSTEKIREKIIGILTDKDTFKFIRKKIKQNIDKIVDKNLEFGQDLAEALLDGVLDKETMGTNLIKVCIKHGKDPINVLGELLKNKD